ncbi:HD domain-containing protein [Bacteroides thetaiotaomicron]|nr:HD domain-containing protein [Bacteroides thetaiotaomicron]
MFKEKIIIEMKEVFKEIPFGIEHTLKVLKNAEDIMNGENIGEEEKEFISIIAILHDIGAVEAQKNTVLLMVSIKKREGPAVAKEILKR